MVEAQDEGLITPNQIKQPIGQFLSAPVFYGRTRQVDWSHTFRLVWVLCGIDLNRRSSGLRRILSRVIDSQMNGELGHERQHSEDGWQAATG